MNIGGFDTQLGEGAEVIWRDRGSACECGVLLEYVENHLEGIVHRDSSEQAHHLKTHHVLYSVNLQFLSKFVQRPRAALSTGFHNGL